MIRTAVRMLLAGLLGLALAAPAHAHVGNKDVFEQIESGPYKFFVTIRTPLVIPGVATVEVRSSGAPVTGLQITPVPLTGEASKHPPASDPMHASPDDPAFFTGSVWLMTSGSWQVRLQANGAAGPVTAGVPVAAQPLSILPMQRPLGTMLAILGFVLALGMAGIVAAAVRESRLTPGQTPSPTRTRRALVAATATLVFMAFAIFLGDKWWNVEAASYAGDIYRPLTLQPTLTGNTLDLTIGTFVDTLHTLRSRSNDDLLLDHGQIMHLYAIRQPGMDAVFHLHPSLTAATQTSAKHLTLTLPTMPPGVYSLYADIVHANGFPETLTSNLTIPSGLPPMGLASEDASASPAPLSAGDLGPSYKLPDGYTLTWDRPATITANTAYTFRFHLLDPTGRPATGMEPYLGMAGHAAFVKADGTTFAHTHPEGSAAMPAVMLANAPTESMPPAPLTSTVEFPYGFPSSGRYRIFIQMKHSGTVETGVFDAEAR